MSWEALRDSLPQVVRRGQPYREGGLQMWTAVQGPKAELSSRDDRYPTGSQLTHRCSGNGMRGPPAWVPLHRLASVCCTRRHKALPPRRVSHCPRASLPDTRPGERLGGGNLPASQPCPGRSEHWTEVWGRNMVSLPF